MCAQKKARQKTRAFRSSDDIKNTTYARLFCVEKGCCWCCVSVGDAKEARRERRASSFLYVKIFDASNVVKSAARGEEETKSSSSSSYNVVSLASK